VPRPGGADVDSSGTAGGPARAGGREARPRGVRDLAQVSQAARGRMEDGGYRAPVVERELRETPIVGPGGGGWERRPDPFRRAPGSPRERDLRIQGKTHDVDGRRTRGGGGLLGGRAFRAFSGGPFRIRIYMLRTHVRAQAPFRVDAATENSAPVADEWTNLAGDRQTVSPDPGGVHLRGRSCRGGEDPGSGSRKEGVCLISAMIGQVFLVDGCCFIEVAHLPEGADPCPANYTRPANGGANYGVART